MQEFHRVVQGFTESFSFSKVKTENPDMMID